MIAKNRSFFRNSVLSLIMSIATGPCFVAASVTEGMPPRSNFKPSPEALEQLEKMYALFQAPKNQRQDNLNTLNQADREVVEFTLAQYSSFVDEFSLDYIIQSQAQNVLNELSVKSAASENQNNEQIDDLAQKFSQLVSYASQKTIVRVFNQFAFGSGTTDFEKIYLFLQPQLLEEKKKEYSKLVTFFEELRAAIDQTTPFLHDLDADLQNIQKTLNALLTRDSKVLSEIMIEHFDHKFTQTVELLSTSLSQLKESLKKTAVKTPQYKALIYFIKEIDTHIKTLQSFKRVVWYSSFDLNTLSGSVGFLSDIFEPYFYCERFESDKSAFSSKALYLDALLRGLVLSVSFGKIALEQMQGAVKQVTIDGQSLSDFVNPMSDPSFALGGLVSHGQLMLTQNFLNGPQAASVNQKTSLKNFYTHFVSPYRKQLIQLVAAFVWHNATKGGSETNWPAKNKYFGMVVGVIIQGISQTTKSYLQTTTRKVLGDGNLHAINTYSLGLLNLNLIGEVFDVIVVSALMQKDPFVETAVSLSPEVILNGEYTYRHKMYNIFKGRYPGLIGLTGARDDFNTFLKNNWKVFAEYKLLKHAVTNLAEYIGRLCGVPVCNALGFISSKIYGTTVNAMGLEGAAAEITDDVAASLSMISNSFEQLLIPLSPNPDEAASVLYARALADPMRNTLISFLLPKINDKETQISDREKVEQTNNVFVQAAISQLVETGLMTFPQGIEAWDVYEKAKHEPSVFIDFIKEKVVENSKKMAVGMGASLIAQLGFLAYFFTHGPIFTQIEDI